MFYEEVVEIALHEDTMSIFHIFWCHTTTIMIFTNMLTKGTKSITSDERRGSATVVSSEGNAAAVELLVLELLGGLQAGRWLYLQTLPRRV